MIDKMIGGFRILAEINSGGQDQLFKAVCDNPPFYGIEPGTVVALKVMTLYDDNMKIWAKFEKRTGELARLSHPNIVKYYGCFYEPGIFNDIYVIVQEWLEGETLKQRLARNPSGLDADETLLAFTRFAHGLSVLHSHGIIHRAIKPAKLYYPEGCPERAVIMDFARPRKVGSSVCTPPPPPCGWDYAAPEMASGRQYDVGCDIYALGLSFYEALSGKTAYPLLPTMYDFLKCVRSKTPPTFDSPVVTSRPKLLQLLNDMTNIDPEKRIRDAAEVERRLSEVAATEKGDGMSGQTGLCLAIGEKNCNVDDMEVRRTELLAKIKAGDFSVFKEALELEERRLREHPDDSLKTLYAKRKAEIRSKIVDTHQAYLEDYNYGGRDSPERVSFPAEGGNFTMLIPKSIMASGWRSKTGNVHKMSFRGESSYEWIYVEHISALDIGLGDGEEEMEDRVEFPLQIWEKLPIHPATDSWYEGENLPIRDLIGVERCMVDSAYMKHRNIDKMASWVATFRRENIVCRVFILVFQRENQGWMVEYAFPAQISERKQIAPGMTMWRCRPPTDDEARCMDNRFSHADCDKAQVVLGTFAPNDNATTRAHGKSLEESTIDDADTVTSEEPDSQCTVWPEETSVRSVKEREGEKKRWQKFWTIGVPEVTFGGLFAAWALCGGGSLTFKIVCDLLMVAWLVAICVVELRTWLIPDSLTLGGLLLWLLCDVITGGLSGLLRGMAAAGIGLIMIMLVPSCRHRIGGGIVKMIIASCVYVGLPYLLPFGVLCGIPATIMYVGNRYLNRHVSASGVTHGSIIPAIAVIGTLVLKWTGWI